MASKLFMSIIRVGLSGCGFLFFRPGCFFGSGRLPGAGLAASLLGCLLAHQRVEVDLLGLAGLVDRRRGLAVVIGLGGGVRLVLALELLVAGLAGRRPHARQVDA